MKFRRGLRSKSAEARAGNEFMHAMYGDGRPPQIAYPERKPKRERAPTVRDALVPSEHQSQAAVISWWALQCGKYGLPQFALFAIPNGGARDIITGARLKQEGVRAGVLDLFLAVKRGKYAGLFIEMKRQGNSPSQEQRKFIEYLIAAGYDAGVLYSAEGAIKAIQEYLQRATGANPAILFGEL